MKANPYRGFSTTFPGFTTSGMNTVKRDLLNHVYTIKGERPHMPDFGTRIPLLAFEPLDEQTVQILREDLTFVVNYDPRIEMIDLAIVPVPDSNALVAYLDVLYVELNEKETLKLEFTVGA